MTLRHKSNSGAWEARLSRKRVAAVGLGVLMTSALALPGSTAVGRPVADGAGASKAGPPAAEAYLDEPGSPPVSWWLQGLMSGVTGALPRDSKPSAALLDDARNLARFTASARRGVPRSRSRQSVLAELAGDPTAIGTLPSGPLGIPGIMLQAYQRAQQGMATQQPGCHLPWWLLAGIGQVESGQADGGLVNAQGNTLVPILGPALDGANGTAVIPASGGGWQRAIGPMQFLPATWSIWGNGNPGNVYDAALAAARYLCAGGWNLSDPTQQVMAVFSYNHSDSYVQQVLSWAYAYAGGVNPLPLRALVPIGQTPAAQGSPASPSQRSPAAARSSSSAKPAPSASPQPRSSSPAPSPSPSSSPRATPKPTPSPLPSLPLPTPSLSLP